MKINQINLSNKLLPFIWHFFKPFKTVVAIYIILALVAGFWAPFNSILVKEIIDYLPLFKNGGDGSKLFLLVSLVIINFIIFDNFTWRGITYLRAKYIGKISNHIIGDLTEFTLSKSHQFYQDNLSGKISKQITNLVDGIQHFAFYIIANLLCGTSLLIITLISAYSVNVVFFIILIIWLAFFISFGLYMSNKLVILSDNLADSESVVIGELVDIFSNQNNVRMFANYSYENLRLKPFLNKQQKNYSTLSYYSLFFHCILGVLIAIMMSFTIYFLIYFYNKNLVTIGDFALLLGLAFESGNRTWYTICEVDEFNKVIGRCKQSLKTLMPPAEIINDESDAKILDCQQGQIIFDRVKFNYQDTKGLFQDKSIIIEHGQKIGLVGYSGGGKSTFVNLILRFYEISDGSILIDGQDIRYVTRDSLRANIAMIPQDPSLFNRNLLENIRYGHVSASDEEVIEAAKKAHAHEFIKKLPQGYETLVGERGIKLSGGQRQRIAIARAILKNAPILILDEATSQLDSLTENLIQESLKSLMQNKTTIVIAHRLSTLLHMDRILVFEKGKIIEDGPHAKLLELDGLYKQLWNAQVGGFLNDELNKSIYN